MKTSIAIATLVLTSLTAHAWTFPDDPATSDNSSACKLAIQNLSAQAYMKGTSSVRLAEAMKSGNSVRITQAKNVYITRAALTDAAMTDATNLCK